MYEFFSNQTASFNEKISHIIILCRKGRHFGPNAGTLLKK